MRRWDCRKGAYVEVEEIDAFIKDIEEVYDKHGFSIAHEDIHGSFIVGPDSHRNREWLRCAHISREFEDG